MEKILKEKGNLKAFLKVSKLNELIESLSTYFGFNSLLEASFKSNCKLSNDIIVKE